MKFFAFAILLVAAGAAAAPQEVDVAQGRIYDLWVKDWIDRLIKYIDGRGWDPMIVEKRDFNIVIISRLAEARGTIEGLEVSGASEIEIRHLSYNFLLGRIDYDVVHRGVKMSLRHADIELIYGDRRGKGVGSGSIEVGDIRIKGNALLKHDATGRPWIYNINAEVSVGKIKSDMRIVGGRDYSEQVNDFMNVRVHELMDTYKREIDTIAGEVIKYVVERLQNRESIALDEEEKENSKKKRRDVSSGTERRKRGDDEPQARELQVRSLFRAPSQERIVDHWLDNALSVLRSYLVNHGLDPLIIKHRELDYIFIDGLVQLIGEVKDVRLEGLSGMYWNFLYYNIIFGRLDFDLAMPRVSLTIGLYEAEGRYGDRGGKLKFSGSLVVTGARIKGNALLRLDPGPRVTIHNINVDSSIENIEADVKASWKCRGCQGPEDISESVNEFMNETLRELLWTFKVKSINI
ncbi:uncharacterized protein LOC123864587 [Maniola jurtina]|uniref:uncharacterized protein LOC123864587 n=1 Tax=Maniola jurtina TaxID=191418 RepID=UPI001E68CBF9|nr:uncharacterized protein LOC123864587 [Maniola jurtina]